MCVFAVATEAASYPAAAGKTTAPPTRHRRKLSADLFILQFASLRQQRRVGNALERRRRTTDVYWKVFIESRCFALGYHHLILSGCSHVSLVVVDLELGVHCFATGFRSESVYATQFGTSDLLRVIYDRHKGVGGDKRLLVVRSARDVCCRKA